MLWARCLGASIYHMRLCSLHLKGKGERAKPSDSTPITHPISLIPVGKYFRFLKYRMDLILSGIVFDELLF